MRPFLTRLRPTIRRLALIATAVSISFSPATALSPASLPRMTSALPGRTFFDVSSVYGLNQIAFPAAVGGSAGRAAVAFYGSTTTTAAGGDSNLDTFTGVWHLYVAHTFDGGLHWTTTDVTPNAPMQRGGLLRGGGANVTRNLLDFFDITIDSGRPRFGRVCERL